MKTLNNYLMQRIKFSQSENIIERLTLYHYVNEKLTLNKDTKLKIYNYFPKDFNELRSLLKELLQERGKDADLNDIDVSKITTFYDKKNHIGLFEDLDPHNIKIDRWNVHNVKNMHDMFNRCKNFNCNLSNWDVHDVEYMQGMFYECTNFNSDLRKWKVNKVTDMRWMFMECEKFNCDISKWDVSNVVYMRHMFYGCTSLKNKPSWYKNKELD